MCMLVFVSLFSLLLLSFSVSCESVIQLDVVFVAKPRGGGAYVLCMTGCGSSTSVPCLQRAFLLCAQKYPDFS